jgi:UDP-glucose 4-epimerase
MKHVLITGATGAVGPRVVNALYAAGFNVRTLSMDPPPVGAWSDDVETRIGDVTDLSVVQDALLGVDSVVHMAALLHIVNPPSALRKKYEQVNVGGTAIITAAAIQAHVRRVVLFSTIAVYGQSNGKILTEDSPPHPDTFYAQTKLAAERIVLEAKGADGGQFGTVLRLGAVYGSRIKGNYQRLIQSLARGRFVPIGKGLNRHTLVYDRDVANAAISALEHPHAAGKIFNVSDGEFHTLNEIIAAMCQALGRKPPCLSLPVRPIRSAAGLLEGIVQLAGLQPPILRATIDKYMEDVAVDSRRIKKDLGFVPRYDLLAGWKETVEEMICSREL